VRSSKDSKRCSFKKIKQSIRSNKRTKKVNRTWKRNEVIFILMESLFHIKCHKILDQQQEKAVVVIVDSILKSIISVEFIKLEVLKILMFVTSGEKDTLKDNL
jgi:hypothetical protein